MKWGLLNGIREAASRNFRANGVPDFLLLEVFCTLAYIDFHVVAFVIFHSIGVTLDLLDCAIERSPGRARLLIMIACC